MQELQPDSTALLMVDLQVGITAMDTQPHSAETILGNAARLAEAFRAKGATVIFVRVNYGDDNELQVRVPHDWNVSFEPPKGWDELDPRLGVAEGDIVVTKHSTSGFYSTDLDVHLRQRGITSLVVGGIATHSGVEATVRSAYDRAYHQVLVHDAMGAMNVAQHEHTITQVFPLMGEVASTEEVLAYL